MKIGKFKRITSFILALSMILSITTSSLASTENLGKYNPETNSFEIDSSKLLPEEGNEIKEEENIETEEERNTEPKQELIAERTEGAAIGSVKVTKDYNQALDITREIQGALDYNEEQSRPMGRSLPTAEFNQEDRPFSIEVKTNYEGLEGSGYTIEDYLEVPIKLNLQAIYSGDSIEGVDKEDVTDRLNPNKLELGYKDIGTSMKIPVSIDGFDVFAQYRNTAFSIMLDNTSFKTVDGKSLEAYLSVKSGGEGSDGAPIVTINFVEVGQPEGPLGTVGLEKTVLNESLNQTDYSDNIDAVVGDVVKYRVVLTNPTNMSSELNIKDTLDSNLTNITPVVEGVAAEDSIEVSGNELTIKTIIPSNESKVFYYTAVIGNESRGSIINTAKFNNFTKYTGEITPDELEEIEFLEDGEELLLESGDTITVLGAEPYVKEEVSDSAEVNVLVTEYSIEKDAYLVSETGETKLVSGSTVEPGATIKYSIVISNTGNVDLNNITVNDQLPSVLENIVIDPSDALTVDENGLATGTIASIKQGGEVVITITGTVSMTAENATSVKNAVTMTPEGETEKTGETPEITVDANNDYDVVKYVSKIGEEVYTEDNKPSKVKAGSEITFTIKVVNTGNTDLENLVVTDTLESNLTFVSADAPLLQDGTNKQLVEGTISKLAKGETLELNIVAKLADGTAAGTMVRNTAKVGDEPGTTDPFPTENEAKLEVTKTATRKDGTVLNENDKVVPGEEIKYTITASNTGNAELVNVIVNDQLPSVLENIVIDPSDALTVDENGLATGTIASIKQGEEVVITITGTVSMTAENATSVKNTVTMTPEVVIDPENPTTTEPGEPEEGTTPEITVDANNDYDVVKYVSKIGEEVYTEDNKPSKVKAGSEITFTIKVVNTGNTDLENLVVTDTLESNLTFVSADAPLLQDGTNKQLVEGTISKLAKGETLELNIVAKLADGTAAGTMVRNTAKVGDEPGTTDPFPTENEAKLEVTKTATRKDGTVLNENDKVVPGEEIKYTITASNTGNAELVNVIVNDQLPSVLENIVIDPSDALTVDENGLATGTIASIKQGEEVVITITGTVSMTAENATSVKNTVTMTPEVVIDPENPTTTEPGEPEEGTTPEITVDANNDYDVVKYVSKIGEEVYTEDNKPSKVKAGSEITFTIKVVNTGNTDLENLVVTDTLESNLTFVSADAPLLQDGTNKQLVEGTISKLAKGETLELNIVAKLADGTAAGTMVRNTAKVGDEPGTTDPFPTENEAKLEVTKTATRKDGTVLNENDKVVPGEEIKYTITASNTGNAELVNVIVNDQLPSVLENIVIDPSDALTVDENGLATGTIASIKQGEEVVITITGTVSMTAENATSVKNTVTMTPEVVIDPENPTTTEPGEPEEGTTPEITVDANNDYDVVKYVSKIGEEVYTEDNKPSKVKAGSEITFTIKVVNTGNTDLENLVVTDTLESNLTFVSADAPLLQDGTNKQLVEGTISKLAKGETLELNIVAKLADGTAAGTMVRNTAKVGDEPGTTDPFPTENEAKLEVTKTATRKDGTVLNENDKVVPGEEIKYTITASNTGNAELVNVIVNDQLPSVLENIVIDPSDALTVDENGLATGTIASIKQGEEVVITITGTVSMTAENATSVKNTVTMTPEVVIDPENPTTTEPGEPEEGTTPEITVDANNDYDVVKYVSKIGEEVYTEDNKPSKVKAGSEITFTIKVVNTGNTDLENLVVTDTLESNLTFVSADAPLLQDGTNKQLVEGTISKLAKGETLELNIVAKLADGTAAGTMVRNTAKVGDEPGTTDPFPTENEAKLEVTKTATRKDGTVLNENDKVVPGEEIKYTITASNTGNAELVNVIVNDQLPSVLENIVIDPSDALTVDENGLATGTIASIKQGEEVVITITGTVSMTAENATSVKNTVTMTPEVVIDPENPTTTEPGEPEEGTTPEITVDANNDYDVVKYVSKIGEEVYTEDNKPSKVKAGSEITFTIKVVNTGNTDLENLVVTDTLESNLTFVSADAPLLQDGTNKQLVEGTISKLAKGETLELNIVAKLADGTAAGTMVRNTAKVGDEPGTTDPFPTENEAKLEVTKTATRKDGTVLNENDKVVPGEEIKYTITASNTGNAELVNVIVNDQLPSVLENIVIDPSDALTVDENGLATGTIASIKQGEEVVITITGTVSMTAENATSVKNTVTMTPEVVIDPENPTTTEPGEPEEGTTPEITVDANNDYDVVKYVSKIGEEVYTEDNKPSKVKAGSEITFTIKVVNTGNTDLENLVVTDTLESNLTFVSADAPLLQDGTNKQLVEGTISKLAKGETLELNIVAKLADGTAAGTMVRNTAKVGDEPGTTDPFPTENEAKLEVTKTATRKDGTVLNENDKVVPGEEIKYTITASNTGNAELVNVIVNDQLPSVLENIVIDPSDALTVDENGLATGTIASIKQGEEVVITITGTVSMTAENATSVKNTVTMTPEVVIDPENPTTTEPGEPEEGTTPEITVDANNDYDVVKYVSKIGEEVYTEDNKPSKVKAGSEITFTIKVVNTGNTDLENLVVTDTLESNLTFVSADAPLLQDGTNKQLVEGTISKLAKGETLELNIVAKLADGTAAGTMVRNTAKVGDEPGTTDPFPTENEAKLEVTKTATRKDGTVLNENDKVVPGEEIKYTITASNTGNAELVNVIVNDQLPSVLENIVIDPSDALTVDENGLATGTIASIKQGEEVVITITGTVSMTAENATSVKNTVTMTPEVVIDPENPTTTEPGEPEEGTTPEITVDANNDYDVVKYVSKIGEEVYTEDNKPSKVKAGSEITFTIKVVNTGNTDLENLVVTDTLESNLTFVSADAPLLQDGTNKQLVEGTISKLAKGETLELNIVAKLADGTAAGTMVRNTAKVGDEPGTTDPFPTENEAKLEVTKTATRKDGTVLNENDKVVPGEEIKYTITASNTGNAELVNVIVNDQLPSVLENIVIDPSDALTVDENGLATGTIASIKQGEEVVITITGTVSMTAENATSVKNTVTMTPEVVIDPENPTTTEPGEPEEGTTPEITVDANNDYDVVKYVSKIGEEVYTEDNKPSKVKAGSEITFTIKVVNTGNTDLENLVVTDTLESNLTFVSADAPLLQDGTNKQLVEGTISKLAKGETLELNIVAKLADGTAAGTMVRNTAKVGDEPGTTDPFPTENEAKLEVTKTATRKDGTVLNENDKVVPGEEIKYTITASNTGNAELVNVIVNDQLPSVLENIVIDPSDALTVDENGLATGTIASIKQGEEVVITITGTVSMTAENATSVKNTVTMTPEVVIDPENPTTTEPGEPEEGTTPEITVDANNDYDVVKYVSKIGEEVYTEDNKPSKVKAGSEITFTIKVVNTGNTDLENLVVTDTLESNLTFVSADAPLLQDGTNKQLVEGTISKLAKGETLELNIVAKLADGTAAGTMVRNTAKVGDEPGTTDPFPTENEAKLEVTKTATRKDGTVLNENDKVVPGEEIKYTITASNTGNAELVNVIVNDQLPSVLENIVIDPSDALTVDENGLATGTIASIKQGEEVVITITGTVSMTAENATSVKNTVTMTPEVVIDPENPTTTEPGEPEEGTTPEITVDANNDYDVVKYVSKIGEEVYTEDNKPSKVKAGSEITFTIKVVNTGNTDLENLVVTDTLESNLTFVSADAPLLQDGTNKQLVEGTISKLAKGETLELNIVAKLADGTAAGTMVRNTAKVGDEPGTTDPFPTENEAKLEVTKTATRKDGTVLNENDKVVPGEEIKYTITASNTGNAELVNVIVNDQLPSVLENIVIDPSDALTVDENGLATGTIASIKQGEEVVITITGTVSMTAENATSVKNTVTMTPEVVIDPENPTTTEPGEPEEGTTPEITVDANNDYDVVKYVSKIGEEVYTEDNKPSKVKAGSEITFTIKVVNTGNTDLENLVVTDTLESNLTFVSADAPLLQDGTNKQLVEGTISKLAKGETLELNIVAKLADGTAAGTMVRNTAKVGDEPGTTDPFPTEGKATPHKEASVGNNSVKPGEVFVYTVTATNNNQHIIDDIVIEDEISDLLEIVKVTDGASIIGQKVIYNIEELLPGEIATLEITVRVKISAKKGDIISNIGYVNDDPTEEVENKVIPEDPIIPPIKPTIKEITLVGGRSTLTQNMRDQLSDFKQHELRGKDRYGTSADVAKEYGSSSTVILASGEKYTDELTATVLASKLDIPIMLTRKDSVPEVVKDEIQRLGTTRIILIGQTGTISKELETSLSKSFTTERIGGETRYETAILVGDRIRAITNKTNDAILVDGTNFPDAIAMTSMGVEQGIPILLTKPNSLTESTAKTVKDWGLEKITIGGGTASVSSTIEAQLKSSISVDRIHGKDRYETSVIVAEQVYKNPKHVVIASGEVFPDAIVGAPYAAKNRYPIVLSEGNNVPKVVKDYVHGNR